MKKLSWSLILLLLLGVIWGSGYSIARFAMTHGVSPLGYSFWQALGPAFLTLILALPKRLHHLQNNNTILFFLICGLIGIALPNVNMYYAAAHLPAGILAVIVNTVPLLIYPLALVFRLEIFQPLRMMGVLLGFAGLMCLLLPHSALPTPNMMGHVLFALLSPLCFALCALYCSRYQPQDCDSLLAAAGMLFFAAVLLTPIIIITHEFYFFHWPLINTDYAILLEIVLSSIGYVIFFKLIHLAGAVFYSLVSGVVALTGLVWGKFIFHEVLTTWEFTAISFILSGIVLVTLKQP
ncbi:MAG: DMT family transporter [Legionellales bacterium]|nr:DMT family transporter [Legionellales bacterium]